MRADIKYLPGGGEGGHDESGNHNFPNSIKIPMAIKATATMR